MNSDEMEKLQPMFNRISRVSQKPSTQRAIPIKFVQKMELLQNSLLDPTLELNSLDYDQLTFDELNQLFKLNKESKIELLISLFNLFFKQKKVVGEIDILGKSTILWSRKKIEIDLDIRELMIHRQNPKEKPYLIDLTEFLINYRGYLRGRYQYELLCRDPNAQIKDIIIGSEDKEEIAKWIEYFQTCCKQENVERSKTIILKNELEVEAKNFDTRDRYRTATIKRKQADDTKITKQIAQSKSQLQYIEHEAIIIEEQIIQENLPVIFETLKEKLNLEFLMDDHDFSLISFEHCARIMQSKLNKNNFRVYVSLPKTSLEILITSLYDPYSLMKWNKQVKNQSIILQATPFLAQIEEIREPLSFIHQPRAFKFLRYIYPVKDSFFIIEKSYENHENDGSIEWNIIGIFMQDLQSKIMIVDTLVYNKGYITQHQDQQLILNYIQQYQNYKQFLKEENRRQQIGNVNLPIFVSEAMSLINRYEQLKNKQIKRTFKSQGVRSAQQDQTVSPNLSSQTSQLNDNFSLDGDNQNRDSFLQEDIRSEQQRITSNLKNDNIQQFYQISKYTKESLHQFLCDRLLDIEQQVHHLQQIHYYQTKPQHNIQLERYEKDKDGKHFFYQSDWVYDAQKGYLKFVNDEKLAQQKKVLYYILQKIGQSLLRTSILHISLPVHIFERRTNLQRFASSFSYAPHFLEPVVNSTPLDQMKAALAFIVSINILYLSLEKPFNPILGETFQCWIKGCPLYLEQISHHPPIAAFMMYGQGYNINGHFETQANLGLNSITGQNFGKVNLEFENGTKIEFNNCKGYLGGITIGDRIFYLEGPIYCIDYVNEYLGELYFNPPCGLFGKKMPLDYFQGSIYKIDEKEVSRWKKLGYKKYQGLQGSAQKYPALSKIDGLWQSEGKNFNVDERNTFNIMTDFPFEVYPEQYPLASDSQNRLDLVSWQLNDFELTMKHKEYLENQQRRDKQLRKKK
ncbi:unnamed protein product (macronuclear) [Paramecium tetraurelia]|uniref:PH domain-containing protein n=1 Tax=Paramecium tetraurelia TaxID=5888 RepID=A0BLH2_PARTE|nr:uncharacterized protein GSPATT00030022001 [Paramecium tetraurelia]CAK59389.1 unnamed protein product [Paramecium tetraurelia]|eukprot:XP_001426787.1 hypothetical protein (macronuclear) [Paramecium tetraurelia strain d4-2]